MKCHEGQTLYGLVTIRIQELAARRDDPTAKARLRDAVRMFNEHSVNCKECEFTRLELPEDDPDFSQIN